MIPDLGIITLIGRHGRSTIIGRTVYKSDELPIEGAYRKLSFYAIVGNVSTYYFLIETFYVLCSTNLVLCLPATFVTVVATAWLLGVADQSSVGNRLHQ